MPDTPGEGQPRRSLWFLVLYALAWAGGSIAYVPFLTILLPVRVAALVPGEQAIVWLSAIAFCGAISASVGHILFGWLSDITGSRRLWSGLGLALSCVLLLIVPSAHSLRAIVIIVVLWQLGLNMMLAPLAAWGADCVPDGQKGLLGGLLAFAPGLGALTGALVTIPGLASADGRLTVVAAVVAAAVLPALLLGGRTVTRAAPADGPPPAPSAQRFRRSAALRMWAARLLVQVAEAALFSFLYLWLRSIDPTVEDHLTARVFSMVLVLSAPAALLAGRWADQRQQPFLPLVVCTLVAPLGLVGMALAQSVSAGIVSYAVFGFSTSIFLALHSAQTLRTLPDSNRRGRDLGLFNLTNTMPSLVMPWFTLALVPWFGFSGLFLLFAALALLAALLLRGLSSGTVREI
ncbi:MFS transporter [Novosphingobium sp.]|uniref:MFS transporter n=1 Tax=Novosphingobium sp. TaxID=1874826 RepID=UPI002633EEB9|nr:MFS transporter [Novosphingobium sp.]